VLKEQGRARQDIPEAELQAVAKAMYEERLAELCTEHRAAPGDAISIRRPPRVRRLSPTPVRSRRSHVVARWRESSLAGAGMSRATHRKPAPDNRNARGGGGSPLREDDVDRRLRAGGPEPADDMHWKLQLILCSAYPDAYATSACAPATHPCRHSSPSRRKRGAADAMIPAHIGGLHPALMLAQHRDDPPLAEPALSHVRLPHHGGHQLKRAEFWGQHVT
jgi:hypothetical protein